MRDSEREGGMQEGATHETGIISKAEMKNTQLSCVALHVSGPSEKCSSREP